MLKSSLQICLIFIVKVLIGNSYEPFLDFARTLLVCECVVYEAFAEKLKAT